MSEDGNMLLSVKNIEVVYNHVILVLKGVSLEVPEGGIVALLGANGAGKSTTLKSISNLLRAERGDVTKGTIEYMGEQVDSLTPNALVSKGVIQVMEGRHCFEHLTVEENLLTGSYTRKDGRAAVQRDLDMVYSYFPRLVDRQTSLAGYVSGGEQQMLAVARALITDPTVMLFDEPSQGLAPLVVRELAGVIRRLRDEGVTVLLVEQNLKLAEAVGDIVYVMVKGRMMYRAPIPQFQLERESVKSKYLAL